MGGTTSRVPINTICTLSEYQRGRATESEGCKQLNNVMFWEPRYNTSRCSFAAQMHM